MPQEHIAKFWACFPIPPAQAAVGDSPQVYLEKLNQLCELSLAWPAAHPTGQLTRVQLRNLCRDAKVDVLVAYAAVMAWGGRGVDSRNYRLSLSAPSRKKLTDILNRLRASTQNRKTDFERMQRAAENINGLGISFYTKLLFFFRRSADAYILDQFTAKSAKLLFDPCLVVLNPSGYPDQNNNPTSYESFCASAEALGTGRTPSPAWTGEQIEQAMFDVRGGAWRKHLRTVYGTAGSRKTRNFTSEASQTPLPTPPAPPQVAGGEPTAHADGDSLPARVARTHAVAYRSGCELPGAAPQVGTARPVRVHCRLIDGVHWQYAFQQKSIHAEVFIPAKFIARYDALRSFHNIPDHDFGDGIMGNGAKNGVTRSLKLTVARGLNTPQNEWDKIAKQTVFAMGLLFNLVCENL